MVGRFNFGKEVLPTNFLEGETGFIDSRVLHLGRNDKGARPILKTAENKFVLVEIANAIHSIRSGRQGFACDHELIWNVYYKLIWDLSFRRDRQGRETKKWYC